MSFSPTSISLSPNTQPDDVKLALKLIFQPWLWKNGKAIKELEDEFKKYLGDGYTFSFNAGRSADLAILNALNFKKGDEVLLQAFTCNAAVNPIIHLGLKPIFVDIDDSLNLNPNDLKKKITFKTKAIFIQHTFGWPAQINEIKKISQQYNLYLIEDCAHALGAKYHGVLCGTFGDASFFSFGRDKVISSVYGGMAFTKDEKISENLKYFQKKVDFPSNFWILQQLLHPILMNYLILPSYNFLKIGQLILAALINLKILSKSVESVENKGKLPNYFPKKIPNSLALLAKNQFKKLEEFNSHRKFIAKIYQENLKNKNFVLPFSKEDNLREPIFLKYPILTKNSQKIISKLKKEGIILEDGWRNSVVVPPKTDLKEVYYQPGSCPEAEKAAKKIINLPTHINITKETAEKIVSLILKC
jgi:dTDP-4-amino-4,6-dideoxygalactose transaminase